MADPLRLQNYQIPPEVARIPVLGPAVPAISSYFRMHRPSITVPDGIVREFKTPEFFAEGKILTFVSEIKLSPNTPIPEVAVLPGLPGVRILESLTPEAPDTVEFWYLKEGVYPDTLWRFDETTVETSTGVSSIFHTRAPVYFDTLYPGGQKIERPILWVWVSGIRVPFTFTAPDSITLTIDPDDNELVETVYLASS